LVRTLLIVAGALALARPLLVTPSRERGWERRISRLIVVDVSESARSGLLKARALAREETRSAAFAEQLETPDVARTLRGAAARLSRFPPSRREVVVISDFQEGTIQPSAVRHLQDGVGIRFVPVKPESASSRAGEARLPTILVGEDERSAADRAIRAVAAANGVRADLRDERVIVATHSAPGLDRLRERATAVDRSWMAEVVHHIEYAEGTTAAAIGDRLLIVTGHSPATFQFPLLLEAVYRGSSREHLAREAWLPIEDASALARLEREAVGVPPESTRNSPEDDARVFWVAAALLLGAEQWWRSRRPTSRAAEREAA
jgi:hypothetical protein